MLPSYPSGISPSGLEVFAAVLKYAVPCSGVLSNSVLPLAAGPVPDMSPLFRLLALVHLAALPESEKFGKEYHVGSATGRCPSLSGLRHRQAFLRGGRRLLLQKLHGRVSMGNRSPVLLVMRCLLFLMADVLQDFYMDGCVFFFYFLG